MPLGYCTTMSWSSSMPQTVPVVVKVSNMPSVHPPWPCCKDCTISRSRSMLTRSPICSPPGFLLPFCSPVIAEGDDQGQGNPICIYYQRFIWYSVKCNTFPFKNYNISKPKAYCIFKIYISCKAHLLHLHQMKKWQLCLEILQVLLLPWISELSYHS